MSISALGIGSGVLSADLVDSLVAAEREPAENRLNSKAQTTQATISAYAKLKSAMMALQEPTKALTAPDAMKAYTATSSGSGVEVTLDAESANRGSYDVQVTQLARAHSLASSQTNDYAARTDTVGTGDLTITSGGVSHTLTLGAGNNSLEDVAGAINELNMGVSASVMDTGSGFRLVMSSEKTGVENAIQLSTAGADANLTAFAGGFYDSVVAQDAQLTINGIDVSRPSNTIEGVIDGVTFGLKAEGGSQVTVAQDSAAVAERVQNFVDKYNALQDVIKQLSGYDTASGQGGLLNGDSTVRTIQNQLRSLLGQVAPGLENSPIRSLADVGISTNWQTGKLDFDQAKFTSQLQANPDNMTTLFSEQGKSVDNLVEGLVKFGGTLAKRDESLKADLRDITDQKMRLEDRMTTFRERLVAQFTAADSLISRLNSTQDYVAQQMAALAPQNQQK